MGRGLAASGAGLLGGRCGSPPNGEKGAAPGLEFGGGATVACGSPPRDGGGAKVVGAGAGLLETRGLLERTGEGI